MTDKCKWKVSSDECDGYNTECGQAFMMIEGTLREIGMKYCCYCGKEIEEVMTRNDILNAR